MIPRPILWPRPTLCHATKSGQKTRPAAAPFGFPRYFALARARANGTSMSRALDFPSRKIHPAQAHPLGAAKGDRRKDEEKNLYSTFFSTSSSPPFWRARASQALQPSAEGRARIRAPVGRPFFRPFLWARKERGPPPREAAKNAGMQLRMALSLGRNPILHANSRHIIVYAVGIRH